MSAIDGLPPLRAVMAEHGLDPKKALGQNFLLDLNLTGRIARQALPYDGHTVIEVGPGPGGLTRAILAQGAEHLTVIEKDRRCIAALEAVAAHYPDRLTIIEGDALKTDISALSGGRPVKIVANLPYNIGTQLLLDWITVPQWPPVWTELTLMFQREVAERIVAGPGTDHYGRLGVLAGWRTSARMLFDVGPEAFTPPPKVTSSVIQIRPLASPIDVPLAKLEAVTAAAFGQRRKMLRQSVKSLGGERILLAADIDPQRRAETLSVEEFCRLAALV